MSNILPKPVKAAELWKRGYSREQIADELNVTVGWTYDLIQMGKGLSGQGLGLSPRAEKLIHKMFTPNASVETMKSITRLSMDERNFDAVDLVPGIGDKTIVEIAEWCGSELPKHRSTNLKGWFKKNSKSQ